MSAQTRPATAGLAETIAQTPLIHLTSLSALVPNARILGKAEFLSPGGSVKDRPALSMVLDAERKGLLSCKHIVESTGGNTGIGLALVALSRGYSTTIVMNRTIAVEKQNLLRTFGADLILVDPAPFTSPDHYYHVGKRIAEENGWFFANQFENHANMKAHYETTGPEIWEQAGRKLDGFVAASGTGGTIAGISRRLKEYDPNVKVFLMDMPSGMLYSYLTTGTLEPLPGNGAGLEGIGIDRLTDNFRLAKIDGVVKSQAQQAIRMAWWLLRKEGIFVGASAAFNVLAACKVACHLATKGGAGTEMSIATILCDSGDRAISKIYSRDWLDKEFGADFKPDIGPEEMRRMIDEEVDLEELPAMWTEEDVVKLD
ncbi:cysteine synthase A [Hyaloraphidium curvatum]|nr:cysteine synthase A [Hyaloraphidium curvatum]